MSERPFRKLTYDLKKLDEEAWQYIEKYRGKVLRTEEYKMEEGFRFPGLILDEDKDRYTDFLLFYAKNYAKSDDRDKLVFPRGNLGSLYNYNNRPVVVCGIAPGFSNLSRHEPKWLLGPSSKILHKILYVLGIFPYFTNIYKRAFEKNNTNAAEEDFLNQSLKSLGEELDLISKIYEGKSDKIYLITLGKYEEYDKIKAFVKSDKYSVIGTYHPSYYLRNGQTSTEDILVQKGIDLLKKHLNSA